MGLGESDEMTFRLLDAIRARLRAFVLGPTLDIGSTGPWGKEKEDVTPAQYGDYLRTSNAVYTCAMRRAENLASLRPRLYRGSGDDRIAIQSGPVVDLLGKVNPYWTYNRLMQMTELSLCLWGEAHWFLERGNGGGLPREIWWAKPTLVRPIADEKEYLKGFVLTAATGLQITYPRQEVIWFRYPNPLDEFVGLSPIAAARVSAEFGRDAMRANRQLMKEGRIGGGVHLPRGENSVVPGCADRCAGN
jgi:HK97 family phage portal protein